MTEVWVLTWKYSDNSDAGVLNLCYEDEQTARHILEVIQLSDPMKQFAVIGVGIVKGKLE